MMCFDVRACGPAGLGTALPGEPVAHLERSVALGLGFKANIPVRSLLLVVKQGRQRRARQGRIGQGRIGHGTAGQGRTCDGECEPEAPTDCLHAQRERGRERGERERAPSRWMAVVGVNAHTTIVL